MIEYERGLEDAAKAAADAVGEDEVNTWRVRGPRPGQSFEDWFFSLTPEQRAAWNVENN